MSQSKPGQETEEPPSKEDMVPCGTMSIKGGDSVKANDGLRGQLNLTQGEVQAIKAKPQDQIWLRVKNTENKKETVFKTMLHNTGRTVTLSSDRRAELDLSEGDSVKYWIGAIDEEESTQTTEQVTQSQEHKEKKDEYVLIDSDPFTYHIQGESDGSTVCGQDFESGGAKTFSNPGDVPLELCDECSIRSSKSMSNEELVRWVGKRAGFEPTGSNPAYLTNEQLTKLRDHILELEDNEKGVQ